MPWSIRQTLPVPWLSIQAGQDHLLRFSEQQPVDALTELIWNSLDAEADQIQVAIETQALGTGPELAHVSRIIVSDNGLGITHDRALQSFPSLGDSWKKGLNGRTPGGRWILHGTQGRGRFYAYALGYRVHWRSVAENLDGQLQQIAITGMSARVNGFDISEPQGSSGPTGTVVTIDVSQERNLTSLLADDLTAQVAARLAPQLLMHPEITVNINGEPVDPAALIAANPRDIPLTTLEPGVLEGFEVPVLTIVEWTPDMKNPLGLVLCSRGGASLRQVRKAAVGPVKATGYLKWSRFESSDLILPNMQFPEVMEAASAALDDFVRSRTEELRTSIVAVLKAEGSYPYRVDPLPNTVAAAERDMFDLVVLTARNAIGTTRSQRAMSARLLHLALQERPADLDQILEETLKLDSDQRQQLADMLKFSTLGSIVGAAAEVGRRLDLVLTLRQLLYGPEAKRLREVDQLHPLVRDNGWLFGEDWRVSRSEASLLTVLRNVFKEDDVVLEPDLQARLQSDLASSEKRQRVDLVLQRTTRVSGHPKRLVVELKRPSKQLGTDELNQIRRYARLLSKHAGSGQDATWEFWLVGSATHEEIEDDLNPKDRAWGHIAFQDNYDIHVTTWGTLLNDAEARLQFYQEQLGYEIGQEEAVQRVRERHNELF